MNRSPAAIVVFVASALAAGTPPARAQVCPWGMQAQLQMQVTWQHQTMMQNHYANLMQQHLMNQHLMQQHLTNQMMAVHAQRQAMHLHLMTQAHQMMHHQALAQHLMTMQQQHLVSRHQLMLVHIRWPWYHGHGPWPYRIHPIIWRERFAWTNTHTLVRTNQAHRVAHLQRMTMNLHTVPHRTHSTTPDTRYLNHLARHPAERSIPLHRQQYMTHNNRQMVERHRPMVQTRIRLGVSCGQCHSAQPSPTVALKPPGNPLRSIVGKPGPGMPTTVRRPAPPMRPIVDPPRQPLMLFVARPPVLQPVVRLPGAMPTSIPWRAPALPVGTPLAVRTPMQDPIALLRPPALPALIDKPLNLTPMPAITKSTSRSPKDAAPGSRMPREGTGPSEPASPTSSRLEGGVLELVSEIARGEPAKRRRATTAGDSTLLPDLVRQAPPRPTLETKYPVPPLPAAEDRPARPASSRPSLAEVVLQPPPLPSVPGG